MYHFKKRERFLEVPKRNRKVMPDSNTIDEEEAKERFQSDEPSALVTCAGINPGGWT